MHVEWGEGLVGRGRTLATDQGVDRKKDRQRKLFFCASRSFAFLSEGAVVAKKNARLV